MRVAYCTAGTVGAGHWVRGVAIGRGLARAGFRGQYRCYGPALPFPAVAGANYRAVASDSPALFDREAARTTPLARALRRFAPDLLLIDLFWAPMRWLLEELSAEAWLLVRSCPEGWLDGDAGRRFPRRRIRRVLAIEPIQHTVDERIDPIVIANRDECHPANALRERLGLSRRRKLVAVVHAGAAGEYEQLLTSAGRGAIGLRLTDPDAPFPAAEWLPGADAIVAGGGYNAFWEARWLGYSGRARFTPFPRTVDDQAWRVSACAGARPRENGADALAHRILRGG